MAAQVQASSNADLDPDSSDSEITSFIKEKLGMTGHDNDEQQSQEQQSTPTTVQPHTIPTSITPTGTTIVSTNNTTQQGITPTPMIAAQ